VISKIINDVLKYGCFIRNAFTRKSIPGLVMHLHLCLCEHGLMFV